MISKHEGLRIITAMSTAAVLALTVAGCSSGSGGTDGGGEEGGVKIGLALYNQLQPRWLFDAAAFEAQAEANGDTVITEYADTDPNKQTQQVQNMLSQGIDVLVIASADVSVGGNLIETAKREGVKTIAYDIGVQDGTPDWQIQRPQADVGTLQAEAALKFNPTGTFALFQGDSANDLAQATDLSYAAVFDGSSANIVYDDFIKGYDPATAQRQAEDLFSRYGDQLNGFVVNNDGMAIGVAQAIAAEGKTGQVFLSGLDADEANLHLIATGAQTMTVYTPVDQMGIDAADAAHSLGTGGTPEADETVDGVPTKYVELVEVSKDNLCEFLTETAPEGWADIATVTEGTDLSCQ